MRKNIKKRRVFIGVLGDREGEYLVDLQGFAPIIPDDQRRRVGDRWVELVVGTLV